MMLVNIRIKLMYTPNTEQACAQPQLYCEVLCLEDASQVSGNDLWDIPNSISFIYETMLDEVSQGLQSTSG